LWRFGTCLGGQPFEGNVCAEGNVFLGAARAGLAAEVRATQPTRAQQPLDMSAATPAASSASPEAEFPSFCICPITQRVMVDPVIGRDGHSYERSAIEDWLARSLTSPITREYMAADQVVSNRGLRDSIEALVAAAESTRAAAVEAALRQAVVAPHERVRASQLPAAAARGAAAASADGPSFTCAQWEGGLKHKRMIIEEATPPRI
jgi:hypothetical protein